MSENFIEIPEADKLDIHMDKVATTLLNSGQVFHGKLVYIGHVGRIGFEIQMLQAGKHLGSYWAEAADASRVAVGEMVQLSVGCRARKGSIFAQNHIIEWMALLLQFMAQKAYSNNDERFKLVAEKWEGIPTAEPAKAATVKSSLKAVREPKSKRRVKKN